MAYLIDTNIIIYKFNGNKKIQDNFLRKENALKYISAITYGELLYGAKKSQRIEENTQKIELLKNLFPILPVNDPVIEIFSDLKSKYDKQGVVIDDFDLLIAATAMLYGLTLVSNNEKHFRKIKELSLENWMN